MNRTTGGTLMNDASSRSHAIFTVSVEIYESKVLITMQRIDLSLFNATNIVVHIGHREG